MSLFRCLAYHRRLKSEFEKQVKKFCTEWQKDAIDLAEFEVKFKINLYVYDLQADGNVKFVYGPSAFAEEYYEDTMHLNENNNHYSYITNTDGS